MASAPALPFNLFRPHPLGDGGGGGAHARGAVGSVPQLEAGYIAVPSSEFASRPLDIHATSDRRKCAPAAAVSLVMSDNLIS